MGAGLSYYHEQDLNGALDFLFEFYAVPGYVNELIASLTKLIGKWLLTG